MKITKKQFIKMINKLDEKIPDKMQYTIKPGNIPDIIEIPDEPDVLQECINKIYLDIYPRGKINHKIDIYDLRDTIYDEDKEGILNYNELTKYILELLLKEVIAYYNDGWTPDWDNDYPEKYFFAYNNSRDEEIIYHVRLRYRQYSMPFYLYMKSEEVAQQVKETMGEYLKQYFECLRSM